MMVVYNDEELTSYVLEAVSLSEDQPILIDQYLEGTEVEVDAIADGKDILVPGIMEHIERTGVHSGDSYCVYPPQNLSDPVIETIMNYTGQLARALKIIGLMNIQFVVKDERVYIIEVNPRASRTIPIISKVTKVPMIKMAMEVILGEKLATMPYGTGLYKSTNLVAVKAPVFSFVKLAGVDAALTPEMKSTGEVLGVDTSYDKAMLKAFLGAGYTFDQTGKVLMSIADKGKEESLAYAKGFVERGYALAATENTAKFLKANGIETEMIAIDDTDKLKERIKDGRISIIINVPTKGKDINRSGYKLRNLAEHLNVPSFSCFDTVKAWLQAYDTRQSGEALTYDVIDNYL